MYASVTPILLFEIGPLSEPNAHQPANLLASQQFGDQAVSTSLPSAGITGMLGHSWLFTWVLESLKSDPHEYTASTFPPSNLFSLWIVCVNRLNKYAVQDSWRGTIFAHLTSAVKKLPVLPK